MALARDTKTNAAGVGSGTTALTWSHTCTGSSLGLFVIVGGWFSNASPAITVTYNSVSMTGLTLSRNSTSGDCQQIFYLVAPSTGSNTVSVGHASSNWEMVCTSISFTDCHQTTPMGTVSNATGNGTAITTTVTTVSGDYAVDGCSFDSSSGSRTGTMTAHTGRTEICNQVAGTGDRGCHSEMTAPGTSQACEWTASSTVQWAQSAVAVKPIASQDTPELYGRPMGVRGQNQMHQLLAQ